MLEMDVFAQESLDIMWLLKCAAFAIFGLVSGSFASALIHRIPQSQPVFKLQARSACPHCGHTLAALDLVPLFSWLIHKGRCQYCKSPISKLYPALEIAGLLYALGILFLYKPDVPGDEWFLLLTTPCVLALWVIDLRHKILPNILVAILAGIGVARVVFLYTSSALNDPMLIFEYTMSALLFGLLAWVLGAIMKIVLNKPALGMGDVKFFAVAGLWLGLGDLAAFCILSGIFGVLIGSLWKKIYKQAVFPFGPGLLAAFYLLMLIGSSQTL